MKKSFEAVLNRVISDGARIAENGLGTIIATEAQMRKADAFADDQRRAMDRKAQVSPALAGCTRRVVDGEIRYYQTDTRFAVVGRSEVLRWFEIRADGTYSIAK